MTAGAREPGLPPGWRRLFGRRPRFNASALLLCLCSAGFLASGSGPVRAIVHAFPIAAAVYLVALGQMFVRCDSVDAIRRRARQEDQGRLGHLWTGIVVAVIAMLALVLELRAGPSGGWLELTACAATLALSWLFLNATFGLHYAHEYYGDDARRQARGGLEFPGGGTPDYWDFAYFAFVLGMTFQVSDVQITSRRMRRIALAHGLLAFVFNVVIVAVSVNVVAGRFQG